MDVSESTFEHDVIERSKAVPVLVDFWGRLVRPVPRADTSSRGGSGSACR